MVNLKRDILILGFAFLAISCSSKKRGGSDAPAPSAPPVIQNAPEDPSLPPRESSVPTVSPLPSSESGPRPSSSFRGHFSSGHSQPVEDEEMKPVRDYDPQDKENLSEKSGPVKRYTGYRDKSGHQYSDAASDLLIATARKYLESVVDPQLRFENSRLAEDIREVQFRNSGQKFEILIKLSAVNSDKSGEKKRDDSIVQFEGQIQNGSGKLRILKTTDTKHNLVNGEVKCFDLNEDKCENSVFKLSTRSGGAALIVLRNSEAEINVRMNEEQKFLSDNFKLLRRLFYNTFYRTESYTSVIEKTIFKSYAVVQGRAGVVVRLSLDLAKDLYFKAPLYVSDDSGPDVETPMSRSLGSDDLMYETPCDPQRCNNDIYERAISEATLTKNNGLGQIQITLKLERQNAMMENEDPIHLRVLRFLSPIKEIDEDSILFE